MYWQFNYFSVFVFCLLTPSARFSFPLPSLLHITYSNNQPTNKQTNNKHFFFPFLLLVQKWRRERKKHKTLIWEYPLFLLQLVTFLFFYSFSIPFLLFLCFSVSSQYFILFYFILFDYFIYNHIKIININFQTFWNFFIWFYLIFFIYIFEFSLFFFF